MQPDRGEKTAIVNECGGKRNNSNVAFLLVAGITAAISIWIFQTFCSKCSCSNPNNVLIVPSTADSAIVSTACYTVVANIGGLLCFTTTTGTAAPKCAQNFETPAQSLGGGLYTLGAYSTPGMYPPNTGCFAIENVTGNVCLVPFLPQ